MKARSQNYKGNPLLKRIGTDIEWSEDLVSEYMKCSEDPLYFIEKYVKIITLDHGLVPFKLYDYQKEIINSLHNNRNTILLSGRQIGKSVTTCSYILWYVLFNPDKTVALLANKGDTAREILGKIQLAYQHLPSWIQQGSLEWNKGSVELENQSRIIAGSTSTDSIRGYTINLLFIDEAAWIDNFDAFMTSTLPTISAGKTSKIILVSTPYGLNHFYDLFTDAEKGKNNYFPIKVTWDKVPGRDLKWKQDVLSSMNNDMTKFEQEHEAEFLGSSGTLIAGWKLKELQHQEPIFKTLGLLQYEQPVKDHLYVSIVDTSRGKGLDYSAFSIIDITKMPFKQVCVFRSNLITPRDYIEILYNIAGKYNQAYCLIEINDLGGQVADGLYNDLEYEHVFYTSSNGHRGKSVSLSGGDDLGFRTNVRNRSIGCSILKLLIEQNQLEIVDKDTIDEIKTFSKKSTKYEAEPGKHDDLIMGLVLFAWLTDQEYFKDMTSINTLGNIKDVKMEDIESDLLPVGFLNTNRITNYNDVVDIGAGSMDAWLMIED